MKTRVCTILIHTYMLVSSLALVFPIPIHDTAPVLYNVGASSWLISIGLAGSGTVAAPIGAVLVLWGCAFPVLLLIFYIMAHKERYIPFCLLVFMDSLIVLFWYLCCLLESNKYALQWAGPDASVSVLFSSVLVVILWGNGTRRPRKTRKTGDGTAS